MIGSLLKECKIVAISPDAAAATTDVEPVTIDMSGYRSICIIASLGDVTATATPHLKLKAADTNTAGTAIAGTTALAAAGASNYDDKLMVLDVKNVSQRYATPCLTRGVANVAVNAIVAILYNGRDCPVTQGSDVIDGTFVSDPAAV